jgi:alkanesulfonate monooxygenase SsuD/methylene tetrahydromethanopterin reductase-like flavin-dependent oxidoreductase (luciferase family)
LAAAAAVTERVRLATTILQLPNRNEVMVAKQAAVIDRLSGGRLDLGVSVGGRESDFKALGARFAGRGKKFERQIRKIRRTWRGAKRATSDQGVLGPAPMQKPLPPIWIGGWSKPAVARAAELGDGYVFGTTGPQMMASMTPKIREMAAAAGKKSFTIVGLAYCALGDDPTAALEAGTRSVLRYYGSLWTEPENLIHHGPPDVIAQAVKEYEQAGIDILILFPEIPDVRQVELIGEHVLPAYRVPAR